MSLFAGFGGFDLAADWMNWQTVVQVEIDEWCQQILAKNFPNAKRYGDIRKFDATQYVGSIDLVCGGFPCQPYSNAGKQLGVADDRHLWPEMYRVICEVKPRWVVGENVRGLLTWNKGLVFNQVLSDLENAGYTTIPPFVIPACGVNAPHKRDRIWIIAYAGSLKRTLPVQQWGQDATSNTYPDWQSKGGITPHTPSGRWHDSSAPESRKHQGCQQTEGCDCVDDATYTGSIRCQGGLFGKKPEGERSSSQRRNRHPQPDFDAFPTQPPLCTGNDGVSARLVRSARVRAFARWRAQTIKAAGNAIVPQVAYQIFQAIQHIETHD